MLVSQPARGIGEIPPGTPIDRAMPASGYSAARISAVISSGVRPSVRTVTVATCS